MAEIALRTSERRLQKEKYLALRPKGSAMICLSDSAIRRKWLEIVCDLVSPAKRAHYATITGYARLCEAWSPALREAWLEAGRPTAQYPHGRLMQDDTFPQALWDTLVKPLGIEKDLPLAPESDVRTCDAWGWSDHERKTYYIVTNTDANDATVTGWNGHDEITDAKLGLVLISRKVVDYETALALDGAKLADIADPAKIVQPDFAAPVALAKFVTPTLSESMELG